MSEESQDRLCEIQGLSQADLELIGAIHRAARSLSNSLLAEHIAAQGAAFESGEARLYVEITLPPAYVKFQMQVPGVPERIPVRQIIIRPPKAPDA